MELIDTIILAFIQGTTEWLPISSSGHLVIAEQLLNIEVPFYYNILLHLATVLVILFVFHKDITNILKAWIKKDFRSENSKLGLYIILGSIPTATIGLSFHDSFVSFFSNIKVVAIGLLITSVFLFSTKFVKGRKKLRWYDSLLIGTAQGLAIVPGISRSGATIATGMLAGIKKDQLIAFSFLLSVPAILGAAVLDFSLEPLTLNMSIGLVLTSIIGYITLKFLIKIIKKDKFHYFGIYCASIGLILLLI